MADRFGPLFHPMKPFWLFALTSLSVTGFAQASGRLVIDAQRYHLGTPGLPEWQEFESSTPHGRQLEITFAAPARAGESTLFIRQRNVKTAWAVTLNGRKIGTLETLSQPLVRALSVPGGLLKPEGNRLLIARPPSPMLDDIVVGEITLDPRPKNDVLAESTLEITVTDADLHAGLPCRLTLVDAEDALAPLQPAGEQRVAARTGVIYTGDGRARIGVAPGTYVLFASRGFEYSVATRPITIRSGETKPVALQIRREVPTPGLIACDTHIHTLTHSKHGDATIDERMLTIAGEGIELAVATDHNVHIDYTEAATRTGMTPHFRSVVGNEVSTKAGHFNAFPVRVDAPVPNAQLTDWTELRHNIRSVTGAKVVTLNHPRDVHQNFTPLGPNHFDASTGEFESKAAFPGDAIEVVTSAAMQSDIMLLYRDWFALLNHGVRVAAIAASDTHHVSEFILGQARTYAASRATKTAEIDISEVCESYLGGRVLVSMGLLTRMKVDERFDVGDLATKLGDAIRVTVEVSGPSWVNADRVELFANGIKLREQAIAATTRVEKVRLIWTLLRPKHDVHLVAIATGPGVTAPFWEISRPYQPASKVFNPRVIGSTNPIWIDGDGDGGFTAARGYAARILQESAGDRVKLNSALTGYDEAVALHVRDLSRAR
jgi:hypothetical protein